MIKVLEEKYCKGTGLFAGNEVTVLKNVIICDYNEFINFNYEKYDVEFRKNIFDKYYCTEAEFIFRTKSIEIEEL